MISLITTFGALALVSGSIGYLYFPVGLKAGIKGAIDLSKNGMVYPIYMNPPLGSKTSIHLFAIENPREVLNGGKMSLQVKGPYKFETYLKRDDIVFTDQGNKVKFATGRKLYLNEAESANLDEKMWLLNPILPGTHKMVRSMFLDRVPFKRISEPIVFNAVNLLLDNYKERLIKRSTPRELLLGRKLDMLELIFNLADRFGVSSLLPPGPPGNIFGLIHFQNETLDKLEIWTGVGGSKDRFAEVAKWRDKKQMDIWRGKCNTIEGTNGELFKPLIKPGKPIRIFLALMCRSLTLDPVGDGQPVVVPELGIRVLNYEISPRTYLGSRKEPDNKCYCDNVGSPDCQYDGLVPVGPCFFDTPVFMSRGNYKGVDRRLRQTVNSSFVNSSSSVKLSDVQILSLEPITGTVMRIDLTIMALVKMVKQRYLRDLAQVQNITYAPLFAATERVQVPYSFVWPLHLLQMFRDNHKPIMAGIAGSGVAMLLMKFFFL